MLSHKAKYNIQKSLPVVNKKKSQSKDLKKLFEQKNSYLSKFYEFVPPLTFLEKNFEEIFGTVENKKIISCDLCFNDILPFFERNDFYIYYQEYRNNFVSKKTLSFIRFLIVDIDKIQSYQRFTKIFKKIEKLKIQPNYILNSGSGIHLIFKIEKVKYIKELDDLYINFQKKICEAIPDAEVDIHGFVQPYRLPGSLTKFFERTTLWKVGTKKHKIKDIEAFLAEEKKEIVEEKQEQKKEIQRQKQNIKYMPAGGKNFWKWFCQKARDVEVGHRYMYMFSLAIVGYKTRISREVVEKKLKDVQERFNERDKEKILDVEVENAMCGYSQKFVRVKWETLSRWTNIEKERNTRRNGRSREEHLKVARKKKEEKTKKRKEEIQRLLEAGYTKAKIAEILGISRQTVQNISCMK